MKNKVSLGQEVIDTQTGFRGIATGHVTYLTGREEFLVTPRCAEGDWKKPEAHWIEAERLFSTEVPAGDPE